MPIHEKPENYAPRKFVAMDTFTIVTTLHCVYVDLCRSSLHLLYTCITKPTWLITPTLNNAQ